MTFTKQTHCLGCDTASTLALCDECAKKYLQDVEDIAREQQEQQEKFTRGVLPSSELSHSTVEIRLAYVAGTSLKPRYHYRIETSTELVPGQKFGERHTYFITRVPEGTE